MGDYVTKKRKAAAENHLELFGSEKDAEQKAATTGFVENFCLYQTVKAAGCKSPPNSVLALKDQPTQKELPKTRRKVTYKVPRKRSVEKKNAH
jgi:hypothetical protein